MTVQIIIQKSAQLQEYRIQDMTITVPLLKSVVMPITHTYRLLFFVNNDNKVKLTILIGPKLSAEHAWRIVTKALKVSPKQHEYVMSQCYGSVFHLIPLDGELWNIHVNLINKSGEDMVSIRVNNNPPRRFLLP